MPRSIVITEAKRLARQAVNATHTVREHWAVAKRRRQLTQLLTRDLEHRHHDDDALFDRLQARYRGQGEYGYDTFTTWQRGTERATRLIRHIEMLREPGRAVLEIGCGDGTLSAALAFYGHRVTLSDFDDWRHDRARPLPFVRGDACAGLDLPEKSFDLVCSYNTWEHLPDPAAALATAGRLLKPGGVFYTEFGPLYASPWGLHAYRSLRMPYPQFLFSREYIKAKLARLGISDLGVDREDLQPLNGWRVKQYFDSWNSPGWCTLHREVGLDEHFTSVPLEFPHAFSGLGLTYEDLTVPSLCVTLRREG